MSRKVNHLRDELRRTFTIYALIPIFVISILVFILAFAYWNTNVLERNQSSQDTAGTILTTIINGYLDKANDIAAFCDISELRTNNTAKTEMYEKLYRYTSGLHINTNFYIFDDNLTQLISNQRQEPEYVQLAKDFDWGIIGQLKRKPAVPSFTFVSSVRNAGQQMDLVIGKAIMEKGKVNGYVLFEVPSTQLYSLLASPYVQIVVKDKYDYTAISTDEFFSDIMNKMKPEFKGANGYFSFKDRKYYVSQNAILNGELTVYAFTFIGGMVSQLMNAVIILLGLLVILSLSIVISVKKQVDEKTKMIDQLVDAFSAVQDGNLDMRLSINTNDEFEIIGESYNMMLGSLKELMQTNQEKARATVISEIKQLESQFNPHFLFNTLENIKFMIKLDPAAASKMIIALSNLLRYSIDNSSSEVTIEEDMEYTQNYLDIQKTRFGSRLNFRIRVPEELNCCIVPKLIIQPIIENAIKYGFSDCPQLHVEIDIRAVDENLIVVIKNSGTEIDEQVLNEIRRMIASPANYSQHSGLYNVNRRIQLMYGESYRLDITSGQNEGTTVTIRLPVHKKF